LEYGHLCGRQSLYLGRPTEFELQLLERYRDLRWPRDNWKSEIETQNQYRAELRLRAAECAAQAGFWLRGNYLTKGAV
jgi:hypothetical protein